MDYTQERRFFFSEIWFANVCSELFDNNLNGSIPATLGNLSNLVSLDLYSNLLSGAIPTTIGAIGTLRYLYVGSSMHTLLKKIRPP